MTDYNSNNRSQYNELDRLTAIMRHEKSKDRKYLLEIEIAKAEDRTVKRTLEKVLADIEKEERRKKILAGTSVLLICLASLLALFYFTGSAGQSNTSTAPESGELDLSETSLSQSDEGEIDATKLTEAQVKKWVQSVIDKK